MGVDLVYSRGRREGGHRRAISRKEGGGQVRPGMYSMNALLSYGELKKKSPERKYIYIFFGRHFGFKMFMRTIVSRYKQIFEGFFFKPYSFYYI